MVLLFVWKADCANYFAFLPQKYLHSYVKFYLMRLAKPLILLDFLVKKLIFCKNDGQLVAFLQIDPQNPLLKGFNSEGIAAKIFALLPLLV